MSGNIRSFQNRVTVFVQICLQFILKVINDSWNRWTGLLNRHPRMKLTDWSSEHVSLLKPLMLLLDRLQRGSKAKFISLSYKEIQHELVQLELKSLTQQFNNKGGVKKSTRIIRIVYHVSSSKSYKELRWIQALLKGLKDSWEFNNERAFPKVATFAVNEYVGRVNVHWLVKLGVCRHGDELRSFLHGIKELIVVVVAALTFSRTSRTLTKDCFVSVSNIDIRNPIYS